MAGRARCASTICAAHRRDYLGLIKSQDLRQSESAGDETESDNVDGAGLRSSSRRTLVPSGTRLILARSLHGSGLVSRHARRG